MKKFIIFVCCLAFLATAFTTPSIAADYSSEIELNSEIDLLVSLDDNSYLVDKNGDKQADPSSLVKVMTALVVLQNEKDLTRKITVSGDCLAELYGTGCLMSGLVNGEQISVHDLLCCLLIPSGNDAALVLANEYGKSSAGFVTMMNDAAKALGCTKTVFTNPHGLTDPNQKSTAKDLAKIAIAAMKYSAFSTIVGSLTYDIPQTNKNAARTVVNTNYMLNNGYPDYYYSHCRGIKTGSSDTEGESAISVASQDGYNYLTVTLAAPYKDTDNDGDNENHALIDSARMFKWAFDNLGYETVTKEGQYVTTLPVRYCWDSDCVRLVAKSELIALVPQGNDSQSVSFVLEDPPEQLDAPLKKGDVICNAKVMFAKQQIGTVELVVAENVSRSMLLQLKDSFKQMTTSTVFKIFIALIAIIIVIYVFLFIRANRRRRKNRELKIFKYSEQNKQNKKK